MDVEIMAIGNVTPDSFYAASRRETEEAIARWAEDSVSAGAAILDIGACSTRPGSKPVDSDTEWKRLSGALAIVRSVAGQTRLSIDTFRPGIARAAIDTFGPMIINDISGGDKTMYQTVRTYGVPYIWTLRGDLTLPARQKMEGIDLILDPGFGFIGSVEKDYECLRRMNTLRQFGKPVLVGVSRKSMIYKPLGLTPETCLTATQAIHLYALEHGATILRTHDVAATAETVMLYNQINGK
jgi:dihydropteroate synthase